MSYENLIITSNWTTLDEVNLRKTISTCSVENKEVGVDDIVSLESCACLIRSDKDSDAKPEIKINANTNQIITHVNIVSEAQVIEIFGISDEYLLTCYADFIDDWDGMAVYHAKITIPSISSCLLKLTRIKDPDRCWIYGIQVTVNESGNKPTTTRFNFENVNKLIEKSGHQISDKAEKFKSFMQLYSINSSNYMDPRNLTIPPQMLSNILEEQYAPQLQDCKKNLSQYFSNFYSDKFSNSNDKKHSKDENGQLENFDCLKDYIDKRLVEIKNEILSEIDVKLNVIRKEENEKLNRIIELLEQKNTLL